MGAVELRNKIINIINSSDESRGKTRLHKEVMTDFRKKYGVTG